MHKVGNVDIKVYLGDSKDNSAEVLHNIDITAICLFRNISLIIGP